MCFPSPGPRCSYHAHKEYIVALQRYENCLNVKEKISLGKILEDKKESYYSTPRGQNLLRRNADSHTGLERDRFLAEMKLGEQLRQKQMNDYQNMLVNKNTSFKDKRKENNFKLSKYGEAAGLTLLFLKENYSNSEASILSRDTILLGNGKKLLVLPSTYQSTWAVAELENDQYTTSSLVLDTILNSSINLRDLSGEAQVNTFDWFTHTLEENDYVGVASVNSGTQDVAIFEVKDLSSVYEPSLKLAKRLGGTTNYFGDKSVIEGLTKGTVFEQGSILYVEDLKKTIIINVAPQSKELCQLSADFFLGWRNTSEGGYFEVRRKHLSKKFDVNLQLTAKKVLFASGVDNTLKALLEPAASASI